MESSTKNADKLIAKYIAEHIKAHVNKTCDITFILKIEKELKEKGLYEYAKNVLITELQGIKDLTKASEACDSLYKIIEAFKIWDIAKVSEELKDIKEVLKSTDYTYSARLELFKRLIELPKFKEMEDDSKIILAMQLGALDLQEIL